MPKIETISTTAIDLTGKTETFTTTARLIVPAGTTISAETVNVVVNIAEVSLNRTIQGVPLLVNGKSRDQEVTVAQTEVEIRIKGPYSIVNTLDAGSISAHVDIEGLREGKHELSVQVNKPVGISAEAVIPSKVEVEIVNK